MSYLRPSNAGLYTIPALNVSDLYIQGVPFQTFIDNIVLTTQFEQAEIDEIRLIIQYLNTTGLTTEWVVANSNINATLKTAIDALTAKTALLNTTALTQSWTITDANRNATLKTAIDGLISDLITITNNISALQTKTQYITSSANTITINTDTINIGQYNALVPSTATNLRGDIYTNQAYFKSLNTSSIFGWNDFITLINASNLPSYVASAAITIASSFMPSDVLRMAGTVSKSGDIQTTNDIKCDEFKMFNTSVIGVDILSKFLVFLAKGNISQTTILGNIISQVFNGEISMKNNNILATNIDWLLTEANDKTNVLSIKNNDILLHLGAASAGGDIEIINSCSGDIVFKNGTNGLKSGTTSVMKIKYNANFLDQIEMGLIDPNLNWATNNSKLFVSQLFSQTNGVTVASPDVFPATNHKFSHYNSTHANTGALILQDGYAGTTNKAIYTAEAGQKLFYNGLQIYPPAVANVGGVGITYLIQNPTNSTAPQTLVMSEVYLSQASKSITLSNYTVNTSYLMATSIGAIPKASNPIISGVLQHDQYVQYNANQLGQIYDIVKFRATANENVLYIHPTKDDIQYNSIIRYKYPSVRTDFTTSGPCFGEYIPVINSGNTSVLYIHTISVPYVSLSGDPAGERFVRLSLENAVGTTLYTWPDVAYSNAVNQSINFGGSLQTINITNTTAIRFKMTNIASSDPLIIQSADTGAQGANGMMYIIHGSSSAFFTTTLFNGSNNKVDLVNNTIDDYVLTLPIQTLDITQFYEPNLQVESYFIQPQFTTVNHSVAFLYNDTYLSHIDSTFTSTNITPNIQQVLTSGNNAGGIGISNLGTIEPTAITGWNVKEITAGTNISRTITSGSYAIANTAPVQDTVAGSGISISKASNVATITNTGIITATAGSNIAVSVASNNLNITNTANVTDVIAGSGISVSVIGSTATISQSVFQSIGNANDLSTTDATISYGQKAPRWYGGRWRNRTELDDAGNATLAFNDIACSSSGKVVLIAPTNRPMSYSTDYGNFFVPTTYSVGANRKWISLAMSIDGETVYALGTTDSTTTTNWRLHISTTHGVFWTERGTALGMTDITTAVPVSICCSGDGKKILFTDARAGSSGKIYYSGDSGVNFNTFNVASGITLADDCAMSSNSQIQYITTNESTGGITHAAIYRSSNFGNTWTKAYTKVAGDSDFGNIDCDTTGRIVVVCRKGGATRNSIVISLDYGVTWVEKLAYTTTRSVAITPNGFRIWFGDESGLVSYSDNYGENSSAFSIGNGITHDRICTNINGTVVLVCNSTSTTVMPYSYIELNQINEIASHHYFSYTTNLLKAQATGTFTAFPSDFDLQNYEYYITFDFDKIYFDKYIWMGFNDQVFVPNQYDALYYSSTVTNNIENLRVKEHNLVEQATDLGRWPIFYSPSAGSFFYSSASITYRFYAPSQFQLIVERQGFTHYRTFSSTVIDGKGLTNTLADGTGVDYHTIRGRIDYLNAKIYLATNTTRWAPYNFMIFYNESTNIGPASVRISNIERKAKNLTIY